MTRARDDRPTRRIVADGRAGELVIEVSRSALRIPAEYVRTFSQIYYDAAAGGHAPAPRKGRRR